MSDAIRPQLLEAFAKLRVADVRDGMDTLGLHHTGSMSPDIRPLWRTRACGIARTVRYLPYDGPAPDKTGEAYWKEYVPWYYKEVGSYPWVGEIEDGDFVVIDQSGVNAGLMGSQNTLDCTARGARGFVSNGGVRDTDEVILQEIPFWSAMVSQTMVQNRIKFDSQQIPVNVGGITVTPGDVIVADGDGVVVVPQDVAVDVARFADEERRRDMATRRKLYETLGRSEDSTVREEDPS